ncbi:hypothetical protein [Streptomyces chartreusis]|uniref:hypothetical protein n=1 Tax=Streptomyces chartreusis TaxID=1969 RepID=UPI00123C8ED6|nr:hypothetical protein [Streptomyces chartreusis]QEV66273.1 hypothetical protein CP983_06055 [Streptomyces chartreusis]GGW99164.1 hypothetical protein GCM10010321_12060 [Streptomyces chartreusis]
MATKQVVMYSTGLSSYELLARTIAEHGVTNTVALFANVHAEDADNYRFLKETAVHLGIEVVEVSDPQKRTPVDVFFDEGIFGNSRFTPCSRALKQEPCYEWLWKNCDPADTVIHIGIKWDEQHRIPGILAGYHHNGKRCRNKTLRGPLFTEDGRLPGAGCSNLMPEAEAWRVEFQLTKPPYYEQSETVARLAEAGIAAPAMYDEGYPHANCAGLCVRGGQAYWELTYRIHRDRYDYMEAEEARFRREKNADVAILRDWKDGGRPLPLSEFRERLEAADRDRPSFDSLADEQKEAFDRNDWGGCGGCFTDAAA